MPNWSASTFDATKNTVKIMSDAMFVGHFDDNQYKETAIFRALAENQNVQLDYTIQHGRCNTVSVFELVDDDQITVDDHTSACVIDGNTATIKKTDYANNIEKSVSFKIPYADCTSELVMTRLYTFLKKRAILKLMKGVTELVEPKLLLNADINNFPTALPSGVANGNTVEIMAANWTSDLISKIYKNAKKHYLGNDLMMINGDNFFEIDFNARYKRDGCCDVDGVFAGGTFKYVWDLENVSDDVTIVMRNGAAFIYSNNKYQNMRMEDGALSNDTWVWKEKVPDWRFKNGNGFNDIWIDVKKQAKCADGDEAFFFELTFRGGIHMGNANNDDDLGLLTFTKVADA